jgi:hypothetical protein
MEEKHHKDILWGYEMNFQMNAKGNIRKGESERGKTTILSPQ